MASAYCASYRGSPPSYEAALLQPNPERQSLELPKVDFVRRALIHILAFSYKIDFQKCTNISGHLLSGPEQTTLFNLATKAKDAYKTVERGVPSLISNSDRSLIFWDIIVPSRTLKIEAAWVLCHLRYYVLHCFRPAYRSLTLPYLSRPTFCLTDVLRGYALARVLCSDNETICLIAPNEEIRLLLGSGVRRFHEKYGSKTMQAFAKVGIWTPSIDQRLIKFCEGDNTSVQGEGC